MWQQLDGFLRANFIWLFLLAAVWNIGLLSIRSWRRARRGSLFPKLDQAQIRFRETFGSGFSHKSWHTRLGGASNCLTIIVTSDELWITTFFPFTAFVDYSDLEHRIRLADIMRVQNTGRKIDVEFALPDGELRRLTLISRRPAELLRALQALP